MRSWAYPRRVNSADLPVSYLQLTTEERDLLHEARAHFDRVVVVLNTANPITLGDLADADAVLWVGSPGQAGIDAVGDVLAGLVNPSGRLVDTYASDPASAPAMQNFGNYLIANGNQTHDFLDPDIMPYAKYLSYSEGIYVGYRYYETRYEALLTLRGYKRTYGANIQCPTPLRKCH